MDATNLDFVSPHGLWGYQATVQYPDSGWPADVKNMSVGVQTPILTWNS